MAKYIKKVLSHSQSVRMINYAFAILREKIKICSFSGEAHIEFCCHLVRGNIDPKETPVYEYVKFVGDFKFHNNGKDLCTN